MDHNTTLVPAPLPEEVIFQVLTFLDVPTLVEKKQVNRTWRQHCTNAINAKRTSATAKVFQTNQELRDAVKKYTKIKWNFEDAEEFAQTYGYPIGKWNVSNIEDFSYIFYGQYEFNEDINDWDVSNATTMECMFWFAEKFHQPFISNWYTTTQNKNNTSSSSKNNKNNVPITIMAHMFYSVQWFNQPLSKFEKSYKYDGYVQ